MQEISASATVDRSALDDHGMPADESAITIELELPEDVPHSALDWVSITRGES
jgi:hypothetical protein